MPYHELLAEGMLVVARPRGPGNFLKECHEAQAKGVGDGAPRFE
jgi:hypothetical protein